MQATKYTLSVGSRSTNFMRKDDEEINDAVSRAAKKLGFHGGGWMTSGTLATVCDRPASRKSNARQSYNAQVFEA